MNTKTKTVHKITPYTQSVETLPVHKSTKVSVWVKREKPDGTVAVEKMPRESEHYSLFDDKEEALYTLRDNLEESHKTATDRAEMLGAAKIHVEEEISVFLDEQQHPQESIDEDE